MLSVFLPITVAIFLTKIVANRAGRSKIQNAEEPSRPATDPPIVMVADGAQFSCWDAPLRLMRKHPETYGLKHALLIGIIFHLVFVVLDLIIYPAFLVELISIRAAVMFGFWILYFLMYRVADRHLYLLMYLSFFIAACGITLMCLVTGQGFASPYYAGNFLVLISASVSFRIRMKTFVCPRCAGVLYSEQLRAIADKRRK